MTDGHGVAVEIDTGVIEVVQFHVRNDDGRESGVDFVVVDLFVN